MSVLWHDGPDYLQPTDECLAEMRVKDRNPVHKLLATAGNNLADLNEVVECEQLTVQLIDCVQSQLS